VASLWFGDGRTGYTQTFQRSRERFPSEAALLAAPAVEPFEGAVLGPSIETVDGFAVPLDSIIMIMPLQSPVQFLDKLSSF